MKNDKKIHIKWAGPNTPFIRTEDDRRFYLSKRELICLIDEIASFVHYYREDFTEQRIDIKDDPYESFESTIKEESSKS